MQITDDSLCIMEAGWGFGGCFLAVIEGSVAVLQQQNAINQYSSFAASPCSSSHISGRSRAVGSREQEREQQKRKGYCSSSSLGSKFKAVSCICCDADFASVCGTKERFAKDP